jgi:hypothetical protein
MHDPNDDSLLAILNRAMRAENGVRIVMPAVKETIERILKTAVDATGWRAHG